MQRFFLALHATTPAALTLAAFMHLWAPAGLPPLAQRPAWAVWVLIGTWLALSALAAVALRRLALWRVALGGTGALLALAGGAGLALGSAQAPALGASLAGVGLACAGIAAFIGPRRVQAGRRKAVPAPAGRPPGGPARGRGAWVAPTHLPFWLCGVLAVESFRLAHLAATGPARPSAMLGLLLAFFVTLPAATLRTWAPRTAALLWALAALSYGGLAAKAGLAQWAAACALCALAAGATLLTAPRRRRAGAPPRQNSTGAPPRRGAA